MSIVSAHLKGSKQARLRERLLAEAGERFGFKTSKTKSAGRVYGGGDGLFSSSKQARLRDIGFSKTVTLIPLHVLVQNKQD